MSLKVTSVRLDEETLQRVITGLLFVVVYRENLSVNCLELLRILHESQHWLMSEQ
ncbi:MULTISPECIES: hypothetical protein [Marinomonas]|uniref:Uncharacterized protein n=1 Tax=Marinomonas arctica TaxID=383750 RepID=A0A7H1J8X5_9GAMM|nr:MULTISPECIES: hypothetical protein [Marinomonas]QNT06941.1 hypothetical protein IBG28_04685 [Marinomonas arctica]GGN34183.1 hypothetical protein GCM10011350_30370 [Marinomonas arctica]